MSTKIIYVLIALIIIPILLALRVITAAVKVPVRAIRRILHAVDKFINTVYIGYVDRVNSGAANDFICRYDIIGYTYRQPIFHEHD